MDSIAGVKKKTPAFLHGVFRRGENAPVRNAVSNYPDYIITLLLSVKSKFIT